LTRPVPSRLRLFLEYWLPTMAYVALIITLSAQPRLQPPFHFQNGDKLSHVLEYFGLGIVLVRALRVSMSRRDPLVAGLVAIVLGVVMAISDELFQAHVPGRESSHLDAMADAAGVVLAQMVYMWFVRD
jgi:VanZ family protein